MSSRLLVMLGGATFAWLAGCAASPIEEEPVGESEAKLNAPAPAPPTCGAPTCSADCGGGCSCQRSKGTVRYTLSCDGSSCACRTDGVLTKTFSQSATSPQVCATASTAAYVMDKYCGKCLPPPPLPSAR